MLVKSLVKIAPMTKLEDHNHSLFELVGIKDQIDLNNVYRNGLHSLKQLEISNLTNETVVIRLESTLKDQINFQLHNENMENVLNKSNKHIATNTVEWSQQLIQDQKQHYEFNQLFNYVNYIDTIELEPNQTLPFILAFLPKYDSCDNNSDGDDDYNSQDSSVVRCNYSNKNCSRVIQDQDTIRNDTGDDDAAYSCKTTTPTSTSTSTSTAITNTTFSNITGNITITGFYKKSSSNITEVNKHYSHLISKQNYYFKANTCESHLTADDIETGLVFEDVLIGETYMKDIIIRNQSAIDLFWKLNVADLSTNRCDWLQFIDASNFQIIDNAMVIAPFSQFILRAVFTPKELGKFDYDLQIENINDTRNIIQTRIHATIIRNFHKETLVVTSGNILDFGNDCVAGSWNQQQFRLLNKGDSPIEISFKADGAKLGFDIKQKSDEEEEEEEETTRSSSSNIRQQTPPSSSSSGHSGQKTPESSDDQSNGSPRPSSPSTSSYKTTSTTAYEDHGSSSDSYSSTADVDINMLAAYNEVYSTTNATTHNTMNGTTAATTTTTTVTSTSTSSTTTNNSGYSTYSTNTKHANTDITSEESYTNIEDMVLKPGVERVIQVSYLPPKDDDPSGVHAGQLTKCGFRIILEYRQYKSAYPTEHKIIQCKASYCTSFVKVVPQAIDFGDTDVGTQKSQPVKIYNRSDILARVELKQFESKVLNCTQQGELLFIQPKSFIELRLDIYPRKVNTSYRRQITLINYLNRDNDQIIEVSSTNIDKNRITFHSLFYRILTPTGANFLDFGPIALNSPAIRTCTLENIRNAPLLMEISTLLPDEIVIYTKKKKNSNQPRRASTLPVTPPPSSYPDSTSPIVKVNQQQKQQQQKQLDSFEMLPPSDTLLTENHVTRMTNADYHSTAYLDLATVPRARFSTIRNKRIARTQAGRSVLIKELKSTEHKAKLDKNEDIILSDACSNLKTNTRTNTPSYFDSKSIGGSNTSTPIEELSSSKITANANGSSNATEKSKTRPKIQLTHINKKQQVSQRTIKRLKQSLGITGTHTKLRKSMDWSDIAGKTRVPFDDLLTILEQGSRSRTPLFPNQSSEEQFVRYQIAWRTELQRLIEKGDIVRTTLLELEPMSEEDLIIVYTPRRSEEGGIHSSHHQAAPPKNQNAWIAFRLLEFDQSAINSSEFENLLGFDRSFIPVRKVIVRAQLERSSMELGQKNINFGVVDRNERHHKTIILHNRAETPLLYTIKKSGSIASGDIKFGLGRHGVVRGFGKREIEFIFEPTLPGSFMEQLEVINIRDKEDTNVISLKANVRRPVFFSIRFAQLLFGPCILGKKCERIETIIITNTNKQSRLFEVRWDPDDSMNASLLSVYNVDIDYTIDEQSELEGRPLLSKEEEEEIENLEQKLKIARRKNQPEKIKKYQKKLAKLRGSEEEEQEELEQQGEEVVVIDDDNNNAIEDEEQENVTMETMVVAKTETTETTTTTTTISMATATTTTTAKTATTTTVVATPLVYKKEKGRIVFPLEPNATKKISVHFTAISQKGKNDNTIEERLTVVEDMFSSVTGRIVVHEHKNIDSYKNVTFSTTICHDHVSFLQQKKVFEEHLNNKL